MKAHLRQWSLVLFNLVLFGVYEGMAQLEWIDIRLEVHLILGSIMFTHLVIFVLLIKRISERWLKGIIGSLSLFTIGVFIVETYLLYAYPGCLADAVSFEHLIALLLLVLSFFTMILGGLLLLSPKQSERLVLIVTNRGFRNPLIYQVLLGASCANLILYPLLGMLIDRHPTTAMVEAILLAYLFAIAALYTFSITRKKVTAAND